MFKFVFENSSFEIADAYQSLLGTCFAAVAINRSRLFAHVPHDDADAVVISMNSTEKAEQIAW